MEKYFIVRADRAGVFFGKIKETKSNESIVMTDVRKIFYWYGACAVEQISQDGVNGNSKLTVVVPEMTIANPIQVIECSEKAIDNLKSHKAWEK
jgi:hypothetical protein